jgi:hypothetical protein
VWTFSKLKVMEIPGARAAVLFSITRGAPHMAVKERVVEMHNNKASAY